MADLDSGLDDDAVAEQVFVVVAEQIQVLMRCQGPGSVVVVHCWECWLVMVVVVEVVPYFELAMFELMQLEVAPVP